VREIQRSAARRDPKPASKRSPEEDKRRKEEIDARKSEAVELAVSTYEALVTERGDGGKIWASMLKNAIKRRKPDFNESYYGFRVFGNLLDEAQARGLLEVGRDEKSGAFVSRSMSAVRSEASVQEVAVPAAVVEEKAEEPRRPEPASVEAAPMEQAVEPVPTETKRRGRGGNKRSASAKVKAPTSPVVVGDVSVIDASAIPVQIGETKPVELANAEAPVAVPEEAKPAEARAEKKPASRNRRPRKPKATPETAG